MNSSEPASTYAKDEIDVIAFLRVVWEFKYVITLVAGIFGFAAVYLALTATLIFRAEVVVVEIDDGNVGAAASLANQFGGLASIAGINLGAGGVGREAQAILRSRHLVEEFIKRNDLLAILSPDGGESSTLWIAVQHFWEIVLTIREDAIEGITTVTIDWTEPDTAARWANEFVALANELIRARALEEATKNIEYLNRQIERTTDVEMQRVMYSLIENETQTLMLANARAEYAFRVVDPAVAPEVRSSPNRKLIVLSGGVLGLFIGTVLAFAINLLRRVKNDA